MDTPDLTFYRLIHRSLRVSSGRLATAISELAEDERTGRGRSLVKWYGGFEGELHEHHTVEDRIFFPALFERVPALAGYVQRLDDEHEYLTELMGTMRGELARVANPLQPFDDAVTKAAAVAIDLQETLDGHLDFEDAEVLPLFERHFDAGEYDALQDRAINGNGKPNVSQLAWTIPWVMDAATPEEKEVLLDDAPFMMKVLWVASRGRFVRLEKAAFGVDVPAATMAGVA